MCWYIALLSPYGKFLKMLLFYLEIEISGAIAICPSGANGDFRGAIDDRSVFSLFEANLEH